MKKKKAGRGRLWIVLICVLVILCGFYFSKQITSELAAYASKASSVLPTASGRHPSDATSPKRQTARSINGNFTFFPDERSRYAWSVKYPDGRVFKFGEEFSSDCAPSLKLAKAPATARFEFVEQRSCNFAARKSIQVDAGSLRDINGDGSLELIASVITGGNANGHTANLISLTPKGPKVVQRLE
jgi:hypothetical protein